MPDEDFAFNGAVHRRHECISPGCNDPLQRSAPARPVGNTARPRAHAYRADNALCCHVDHRHRTGEGVGDEHAPAVIADDDSMHAQPGDDGLYNGIPLRVDDRHGAVGSGLRALVRNVDEAAVRRRKSWMGLRPTGIVATTRRVRVSIAATALLSRRVT